jgi:hypothetical protein
MTPARLPAAWLSKFLFYSLPRRPRHVDFEKDVKKWELTQDEERFDGRITFALAVHAAQASQRRHRVPARTVSSGIKGKDQL